MVVRAAQARQMVVRAAQARQMVVRAPQARQMVVRAPQARQMVTRGERVVRSPWVCVGKSASSERATENRAVLSHFQCSIDTLCCPGAACSLRSHLPLATLYRACSALPLYRACSALILYRACSALTHTHDHLPKPISARTNNEVNFR